MYQILLLNELDWLDDFHYIKNYKNYFLINFRINQFREEQLTLLFVYYY